ncbi:tetrahydrofolate synthase [Mobiluncus mulieris]|uniref:Tetrahydrofolate synthase n=1 Tax=Mobiluncus mulieris TaxID=2052 RepID=A0A7Y0USV7_9ACTO|nr:tetrahydrofolate synthase [Mobiluncus mulieris]NMX12243.1 tetrahydrofolate synthase [Mobiluncus mulieris]
MSSFALDTEGFADVGVLDPLRDSFWVEEALPTAASALFCSAGIPVAVPEAVLGLGLNWDCEAVLAAAWVTAF